MGDRMASVVRLGGLLRLIAALAIVLWPAHAAADSWGLPDTETYLSPDGQVRLTVIPRAISNQLEYFDDLLLKKEQAGQDPKSQQTSARGVLERKTRTGWTVIWDRALVNNVAPVTALTANSGRYVVTFDNWHSVGFGDHVVVIYGPDGSVIRSLSLEDFLPADYVKALPRSISSIYWSGKHRISNDEKTLILKVVFPATVDLGSQSYTDVRIDLATGQPQPLRGRAWEQALAEAAPIAAARRAVEAEALAAEMAPLYGPRTQETIDWEYYLFQAFLRLDPDGEGGFPVEIVLPPPEGDDYDPPNGWLREELLSYSTPKAFLFASPASPGNLVKVLTEIGREVEPGALKQLRIYVAVEPAYHEQVTAALAPTGATLILLDPAQPIPQRKERLPKADPAD